ncbi:MAG TPA: hypothetical protein DDZ81_02345 [Acetobacteraceae bacterium]|jgi:hypothetical protein|nr:hypothetical protein [Acetobacteraceae bacterium]
MTDARAREQLRQERETFDQAKAHDARWFTLRLAAGYAGIGLLLVIALGSGYLLLFPASYSPATIAISATTLLGDMLGLVASIFKLVLQQRSSVPLKPVTGIRLESY